MENKTVMKCRAKINLGIDVLDRLPNGYHTVRMVMMQVDVFDTVTVSLREDKRIVLRSDDRNMPCDESNLAYRAAKAFFDNTHAAGCDIYIEKRIPMGAGMAGGSADAAGVINGLNRLFGEPLSLSERMKIGGTLGADIPYCVMGGCALAEGTGEALTKLPEPPPLNFVIAKPRQSISTKWAYEHLDFTKKPASLNIDGLIDGIKNGNPAEMFKNMGNILENVSVAACPEIREYKKALLELGADYSMMSGSGSAVFGIFTDGKRADKAYAGFKELYRDCDGVWRV